MAVTVHVIPDEKGWRVQRRDDGPGTVFPTQKTAVARAIAIAKRAAKSQVVVHMRDGRIRTELLRGLPAVQHHPLRSSLGSRNIQRAVSKVVLERLSSGGK